MIGKQRASQETVDAFLRTVYPEMTELAVASNGEAECLIDATSTILSLRSRLAALEKVREVAAKRPDTIGPYYSMWMVKMDAALADAGKE